MFSGIGAADLALNNLQHKCVGFSEIDRYAISIYNYHFPNEINYGDATKINERSLPDFDMLLAGFPCQAFSIAGGRRGFEDTRGTLFFDVARIAKYKQPRYLLLENVKGLVNHQGGETFTVILETLWQLGYSYQWGMVNCRYFGLPQNRERVFICAIRRDIGFKEVFPIRENDTKCIQMGKKQPQITGTINVSMSKAGNKQDANSRVLVKTKNGIRRLTPLEIERLMGLPDNWTKYGILDNKVVETSNRQRIKCCGNALVPIIVENICKKL